MTTTCMRDSVVGDTWIYNSTLAVPVQRVIDAKTGQPTGDFLTGPVRLVFTDSLFELPAQKPGESAPKFGTGALFNPWTDFSLLQEEVNRLYAANFSEHYDAQTQAYHGLHSPFHQQAEKLKFSGFTPGLVYANMTSKFKPPIVDIRNNPIVDKSKVYPGVWAILGINAYKFSDKKKGVSLGLQSVMIIGDDTKLGGGGPDTGNMFQGARGAIQAPTAIAAGAAAGMQMGGAPAAPTGLPAAPAGGTYAAPPAPPGAPLTAPPVAGATQYAPPTMPTTAPPAPPAGDDDTSWME